MKNIITISLLATMSVVVRAEVIKWTLDGRVTSARYALSETESAFAIDDAFTITAEYDSDTAPYKVVDGSSYTSYYFEGGEFQFSLSDGTYVGSSEISEIIKIIYPESDTITLIFKPAYKLGDGTIEGNYLDFFPEDSGQILCEMEPSIGLPKYLFPREDRLLQSVRFSVPWYTASGHIAFSDSCSNGTVLDITTDWFFADGEDIPTPKLSIEYAGVWGNSLHIWWIADLPKSTRYHLEYGSTLGTTEESSEQYFGTGQRRIHTSEIPIADDPIFFRVLSD